MGRRDGDHTSKEVTEWLHNAQLLHHADGFKSVGVFDMKDLRNLTLQEYGQVGITDPSERRRLFELLQATRSKECALTPPSSSATPSSSGLTPPMIHALPPVRSAPRAAVRTRPASEVQTQLPSSQPLARKTGAFKRSLSSQNEEVTSPQAIRNKEIIVCVRKRPLPKRGEEPGEADATSKDVLRANDEKHQITVLEPKVRVDLTTYTEKHVFPFDQVLADTSNNMAVYSRVAKPLIDTVYHGGRATCFAYGQTGSGKTHTMMGTSRGGTAKKPGEQGLYALAATDLFKRLNKATHYITVSHYELYGGRLYDLCKGRKKLEAREDGLGRVNIIGLTEHRCSNVGELMKVVENGNENRSAGSTGANADSSRSHAILAINLRSTEAQKALFAQFTFIDLAGSERGADTMDCDRVTRMEGAAINRSLLALKECIRALGTQQRHIPFRGSKLTEVLRESFTSPLCTTAMIACVSPASSNCEHTLNTLRYAARVKEIKNNTSPTAESKKRSKSLPHKEKSAAPENGGKNPAFSSTAGNNLSLHAPQTAAPKKRANAREAEDDLSRAEMERKHEKLIDLILEEEEDVLAAHREHIDQVMELIKMEMHELTVVDRPGSSVDKYIRNVDGILGKFDRHVSSLRSRLTTFKQHIKEEEDLSKRFQLGGAETRGC